MTESINMLDLRTIKRKTLDVDVADLGGVVRLQQLGAVAFAATQAKVPDEPTGEDFTQFNVELLAQMIVDGDGEAYLDNDEGRTIIRNLSLSALLTLSESAAELNGTADSKKN